MTILFLALIVIASIGLGFLVLIQNPKGGGLSGNLGGLSNQFMGVKQTTDVLEKGTWLFAGIIATLALVSSVFLKGGVAARPENLDKINTTNSAPANNAPANNAVPLNDTGKK